MALAAPPHDNLMPLSGGWAYDTYSHTPIGFYDPNDYHVVWLYYNWLGITKKI